MNYLKNVGISFIYIICFLLGLTFISTLFNYINLFGNTFINVLKVIIPIISLFVGGFVIGKRTGKKGWLEGIKLGLIFLAFLTIFNYLALDSSISLKTVIYYIILVIATTFGSMIGVNKFKPEEK
jgi:putative membrane protein (TIGR04086 family)